MSNSVSSSPWCFIVTGIPRSGTSLFSALLNSCPGVVCLNEILYNVDSLHADLLNIKGSLERGEPAPNKYNQAGELTTDTTISCEVKKLTRITPGGNVVLGSKVNYPYLEAFDRIRKLKCPVFALVRDPVYTIASWSSSKAINIPEFEVGPPPLPMRRRWDSFPFQTTNPVSRRAELWNHMAGLIIDNESHLSVVHYETLVSAPHVVLANCCAELHRQFTSELPDVFDGNISSRFVSEGVNLEEIRDAVRRFAPRRLLLGYE